MYKSFYGLERNPFDLSPDPRFYYPTDQHNEALANLFYAVERRKGFMVLTGEVGTGKTLLVRWFMTRLEQTDARISYIVNPRLSADDFLQYMLEDFGAHASGMKRSEMLLAFNHFLIEVYRGGSTAVLIIDEAHLLTSDALEDIRLLTNLETPEVKLLQIVLVGQPELEQRLDSMKLRQLKQRMALRCRLQALPIEDVGRYIDTRLKRAGAHVDTESVFPAVTVERVAQYSRGIPRLINTICEGALIAGCARQSKMVTTDLIDEVATDFNLTGREPHEAVGAANEDVQEIFPENDNHEPQNVPWAELLRELIRTFRLTERLERRPRRPIVSNEGVKTR